MTWFSCTVLNGWGEMLPEQRRPTRQGQLASLSQAGGPQTVPLPSVSSNRFLSGTTASTRTGVFNCCRLKNWAQGVCSSWLELRWKSLHTLQGPTERHSFQILSSVLIIEWYCFLLILSQSLFDWIQYLQLQMAHHHLLLHSFYACELRYNSSLTASVTLAGPLRVRCWPAGPTAHPAAARWPGKLCGSWRLAACQGPQAGGEFGSSRHSLPPLIGCRPGVETAHVHTVYSY